MKVTIDNKRFSVSDAVKQFADKSWKDLKFDSKARWVAIDQLNEDIAKKRNELRYLEKYRDWKIKEIDLRDRIDLAEYSVRNAKDEETKKDAEMGLKDLENLIKQHMTQVPKK